MNLAVLTTAVLTTAAGHGLLKACDFRSDNGPEWFGYSFAAGSSALAIVTLLLSPWGWVHPVATCAILVLLTLLPFPLRRPGNIEALHGWPGFLPALVLVLLSFWLAAQRPLWNEEAQARWVLHGQWLAAEHSAAPELVRHPDWAGAHPTDPPLLAALVGLALQLGADRDTGVRPLFPFFWLALLGVLHGYARRHAGWKPAPALTTAFAMTPCFAFLPHAGGGFGLGADAALADVPLALALATVCILAGEKVRRPHVAPHAALALLSAGAMLIKSEGALYLPLVLGSALAWTWWERPRPDGVGRGRTALLLALGAALLAAGGWKALVWNFPALPGAGYLSSDGHVLAAGAGARLQLVAAAVGREFARVWIWGLLWVVPAVWLLARSLRRRSRASWLPGLWLLLALLLLAARLATRELSHEQLAETLDANLTRWLMHHAPLAAMMACHLPRIAQNA